MTRRGLLATLAALAAVCAGAVALDVRAARSGADLPAYYVVTRQKAMALTFDNSWGEKTQVRVLDLLERLDQKATFFLSGPWARQHPALVARMAADGDEVASHGEAHVNLSGYGREAIAANIRTADDQLRKALGGREPAPFFRPPNGDWNGLVVRTARELGYTTVIWSIDSLDWKNPGPGHMIDRVERQAFPGAILLFHSSDSSRQVQDVLPVLIPQLRREGWRLVTLGELAKLGPFSSHDPRGAGFKPNWPPDPEPAPR
jgi:peptidoglycan/xylan/chitin deacetylase (PgdA/CDA1 family)